MSRESAISEDTVRKYQAGSVVAVAGGGRGPVAQPYAVVSTAVVRIAFGRAPHGHEAREECAAMGRGRHAGAAAGAFGGAS
eukprot:9472400-Pyramimonas_sp.AAC.1